MVVSKGERWQNQVQQLISSDEGAGTAGAQSTDKEKTSSQHRKTASGSSSAAVSSGSGRAVSLKLVESLIAEGEKLSFLFAMVSDILSSDVISFINTSVWNVLSRIIYIRKWIICVINDC